MARLALVSQWMRRLIRLDILDWWDIFMTALRTLWGAPRRKRTKDKTTHRQNVATGMFSTDHNTTRLDCLIWPHGAPLFSQTALLSPAPSSSPSQLLWFKALLCVQLSTSHPPIPLLSSNLSDPGPCDSIYSFSGGGGTDENAGVLVMLSPSRHREATHGLANACLQPETWEQQWVKTEHTHTHQLDSEEFGHMFSICHGKYILLRGNNTGGQEASNTVSLLLHGGKIWPSLSHDAKTSKTGWTIFIWCDHELFYSLHFNKLHPSASRGSVTLIFISESGRCMQRQSSSVMQWNKKGWTQHDKKTQTWTTLQRAE